ncbi:hypothetical protein [Leptospira alstonii]|uniref:Uncharacterized protein n=1 Tax=Leptospira alstonii serovar Sichuan str. 79601 TaxID=1218565 RepID=M6CTW0_9LEPT|nr:hypothetical protein [Leptospira alstonii]AGS80484.1 hypothetical protein LEP1GSC193_0741 [Leptospira phage vB_LalZ_80412-LE1]EMJ95362.1 hypothetical protein LEP1GSC194_3541 [Leptospira alstonii serovar Sichuan str. 79601]
MLKDAISRLKERLTTNVTKSSINESDLQTLASTVTTLLDSGKVEPKTDKIKEWAVSKGLEEAEAISFAEEVIDAYFDDTTDETVSKSELGDSLNGEEEEESEEKKKKEEKDKKKKKEEEEKKEIEKSKFISEIQNTLEILKSGQETLAAAIEHLLDNARDNQKLKSELLTLKSEIGSVSCRPANTKTPVTTQIQKSNLNGQVDARERDNVANKIIKGIELGKCQLEDVSYFQSTWKLSERAQKFFNEYKEVLK